MTETLAWRMVGSEHVWFDDVNSREPSNIRPRATASAAEVWSGVSYESAIEAYDHVSGESVEGLPLSLVQSYADRACWHARVQEVDPGVWYASVAGLDGAYGDGGSRDEACRELRAGIVGWVAVKRRLGQEIPLLDGIDLNPPGRAGFAFYI